MISKKKIAKFVNEQLGEGEFFLVDISIKGKNIIKIFIDGDNGVKVSDCINLSRYVESSLDREEEDFALEVSSYGLGNPFKVFRQYKKNLGRKVAITSKDDNTIEGIMTIVEEKTITVEKELTKKEKKENINAEHIFIIDEIKEAKGLIQF